ncbi:6164_t:CDS:2 [Funneliformis geosporum]|uniref:16626_t:CDS:1 n=1 Tax=Funneliformis geosporum TaxID=1117311 RepID=A0A9W4WUD1_9GLOM|nr:16626_t:CDS:2 [Funneliformis geosporum]CAI2169185.1 6164_t:CDS:2 [Funneliformis geosporum]
MALKRLTFFGSPPLSPTKNPTISFINFPSQEKLDDKLPNADDVRKAIDNLERLVLASDAYRDVLNKLNKATKTFGKLLKDYSNSKGMESIHVMCLQTTSQFYENSTEIQSKLNKALQKDFEAIQKYWEKYSKKVAQYMTTFAALGSNIGQAQKEYAEKVAKREKRTHTIISQIVCRLAEGQFAYFNDSLKRCGPSITKMKEWEPFAGEDMPPPQDLDDFLEEQASQSQSDKSSITSEKKVVSIASIAEKQIAAMNLSQESRLPFNEEPENNVITTRYVQTHEQKSPVITTPETTKPTYHHPFSLTLDGINNHDKKSNESTSCSSLATSSVPTTPIVQPALSVDTTTTASSPIQPSNNSNNTNNSLKTSSTLDLFSRFSIGVRDDDDPFIRDEKAVEFRHPEVFVESKVEKNVSSQNVSNQFINQEERSTKFQNKDEEKPAKLQVEESEQKDLFKSSTFPPNKDDISNNSNATINDVNKKDYDKPIEKPKIEENEKTKRELPPVEKPNENNETIKLTLETSKPIKDNEIEITNEKKSSIDNNFIPNLNNDNYYNTLNTSVNQSPPQVCSESPKHIFSEFSLKKEIPSPSRSPVPLEYSYDGDEYRKEYKTSRKYDEDSVYYQISPELNNNERVNEMNRYTNRDVIHRDETLIYNSSIRGERTIYNDANYDRPKQYIDDDYESYDYVPSQNPGSYDSRDTRDRPFPQRPYNNNHPIPPRRGSSVREMTNRFQLMNEERKPISHSTRQTTLPTSGRVNEITTRFGERRATIRNENPRGGDYQYESYNVPIDYRNDRFVTSHDGITPIHLCDCHNCQMASSRIALRHNTASYNPRIDSDFGRKHYNR